MTDRELLELAAKAAGYVTKGEAVDAGDTFTHLVVNAGHGTKRFRWNPLTDDGDALRLAVKLNFRLDLDRTCCVVTYAWDELARDRYTDDPLAATRRAIVRAAAEIGKAMK